MGFVDKFSEQPPDKPLGGRKIYIIGEPYYDQDYRKLLQAAGAGVLHPNSIRSDHLTKPTEPPLVVDEILGYKPPPDVVILYRPWQDSSLPQGQQFSDSPTMQLIRTLRSNNIPVLLTDYCKNHLTRAQEQEIRDAGAVFRDLNVLDRNKSIIIPLIAYIIATHGKQSSSGLSA